LRPAPGTEGEATPHRKASRNIDAPMGRGRDQGRRGFPDDPVPPAVTPRAVPHPRAFSGYGLP